MITDDIPSGKHTESYWKWSIYSWFTELKVVIFNSYVSLAEGIGKFPKS